MTPSENKNQNTDDQTVERRVEAILGPPPQEARAAGSDQDKANKAKAVQETPLPTNTSSDADKSPVAPSAGQTIKPNDPGANVLSDEQSEATQPEVKEQKDQPKPENSSKDSKDGGKIKRFFHKWWHTPKYRRLTYAGIVILLLLAAALPGSRYFVLNSFGVRSAASLTVLDDSTRLPLKNVEIKLAGQTTKTDDQGKAAITHVKLGNTNLLIQKRAFADLDQKITIGWGSNQLGDYSLHPTGDQYTIYVKDLLTGKTISNASASTGDADANGDSDGKILLTIDTTNAQQDSVKVTVHADNYRDEQTSIDLNKKQPTTVKMVTSRRDVFVSNSSGKYDVYSVDIDGQNRKLVLAGTGLERSDMTLVQHPSDNQVALVSSRVNARNSDGYLLDTLTLINLDDNSTRAVAQSEQIQIAGWIDSHLVYVQIAAGASAANPQRFRLMTYDYKTGANKQLAAANSFNDVLLEGGFIYFAPSAAYQKDSNTGLFQISADGSSQKSLLKQEVWNIFRINFKSVVLSTDKLSYGYDLGSLTAPAKIVPAPVDPQNRLYITSPDGKHSIWVDQRDGKGLLINHDIAQNKDTTLITKQGLIYPVKWLNNEVVVFRVHSETELADYAIDINGGNAHKITDLYNVAGQERWYYY